MSWRRFVVALFVLLTAVGISLGPNLAHAAPQATFGPPKEGTKVILADTSIDGPAIMNTYRASTVLAWTGTDAAHHLNIMTSSDGLHYSNKHILPETSLWRPALTFLDSGRGEPYGTIVVAWAGVDRAHTLNIEYIKVPDFTVTKKTTFWGETSFTAPALTAFNNDTNADIYLSWAGTDTSHTLNVLHLSLNPQSQDKHILHGWSSVSRPNLAASTIADEQPSMILSWTNANKHISFATADYDAAMANQLHWTMPSSSPLSQHSAWAPSMIATNATVLPTHWLAWTGSGTTSTKNLHVLYTQHFPAWSDANASVTLGETAISSPEMIYNGLYTQRWVLLTWAGTDSAHHINIAQVGV